MTPSIGIATEQGAARRASILVVESRSELSLLLDYYLSALGYRIELVERGDAAERRLAGWRPDLAVLDWASSGVSGIELLRRLRKMPTGDQLPILLLAASRDRRDAEHAIASGADDVVTDPYALGDTAARIAALLRVAMPHAAPAAVAQPASALPLNPMTRRLLGVFSASAGHVLDRRHIHQSLWGPDVSFYRHTVDGHVARLSRVLVAQGRCGTITCHDEAGYRYDAP